MSAQIPISSLDQTRATSVRVEEAIRICSKENSAWWKEVRSSDGLPLSVPDVGPACEVVLADALFHDLQEDERNELGNWIRSQQSSDGSWRNLDGQPDLSLSALGWWACQQLGDDPSLPHMQAAKRVVHQLGGAQRGSLSVRLWLALSGNVPWTWIPAVPGELWLLSPSVSLSPARLSTWARSVMMAVHVLSQAPARIHLSDPQALLLRSSKNDPILPRLTREGLGGDLLQYCDRAIRLTRKIPRGPLARRIQDHLHQSIRDSQQEHGGWFSLRPTIYSLLALRTLGVSSNDHRIRRGLSYLRKARRRLDSIVPDSNSKIMVQGLGQHSTALVLQLAQVVTRSKHSSALSSNQGLNQFLTQSELSQPGPWQYRANCDVGGWPIESESDAHLDTLATALALDSLRQQLNSNPSDSTSHSQQMAMLRRGTEVLMAMQEPDGSFARFERGETAVPLAHLPWREAKNLALCDADDESRVSLSALCLRQLNHLGWQRDLDRVAKGICWLEDQFTKNGQQWKIHTLAEVARTTTLYCDRDHPLRQKVEFRLRSRQNEDGSFGTLSDTAYALTALLDLEWDCVQAQRAAESLVRDIERYSSANAPTPFFEAQATGIGLSPKVWDLSAPLRNAEVALSLYLSRSLNG